MIKFVTAKLEPSYHPVGAAGIGPMEEGERGSSGWTVKD